MRDYEKLRVAKGKQLQM